jgi:hypothetical protein
MKQSYFITQTHQIHSDDNGKFDIIDLNLALATIAGWQYQVTTPMGDIIITRPGGEEGKDIGAFIPTTSDPAQIEKLAEMYGLEAIMPLSQNAFAQVLIKSFPCVITPVTSFNGALVGGWRVESVGLFGGADLKRVGWQCGPDEYTETHSLTLSEAIGLNVLSRAGMGKKAFFYYPDLTVSNGELIYLNERTLSILMQDQRVMVYMVAVPELDAYSLLQAPAELVDDARILADAEAVINKVILKQDQDAKQAAEEALKADSIDGAGTPAPDAPAAPDVATVVDDVAPVADEPAIVNATE